TQQLLDGVEDLDKGTNEFHHGSTQLVGGANDLFHGMKQLDKGTNTFHEEMARAVKEIEDAKTTNDTYEMIANPVQVHNEKVNEVPNYGTGFAPYFLSL